MSAYHSRDTMLTQSYQILETITAKNLANVCARFKYKGFIISFSTHNYDCGGCSNEILLLGDKIYLGHGIMFYSVQDATEYVDKYHKEQVKLDSF